MSDLLIGGISGITSRTLTAPLELHKLHKQNPFMPHSTWREVIRIEGIHGLWKGNFVNSVRIFPQMSINYYIYHMSRQHIWLPFFKYSYPYTTPLERKQNSYIHFLSGATAGIVSTCVIYPLETIRSRLSLQTNNNHYSGVVDSVRKISIRDLYKGLAVSICGFVPFNALSFAFYHKFKNTCEKIDPIRTAMYPGAVQLLAGGGAGVASITITYPTDIIRKRMQLQNFDPNVPKYDSARDCLRKMYLYEGGIRGVYCGLVASYVKLFPALAIQFYTMETLRTYFRNKE